MANRRIEKGSTSYPPPRLTASRNYVGAKAKEILATHDITGIKKLVTILCHAKETEQETEHLYKTFAHHFPNILAVKLLKLYMSTNDATTNPKIRSFSLSLLASLLNDLDYSGAGLKTESLKSIKTHLNTCLYELESSDEDFGIISRIVSHVAVDVFIENHPWDELCSYIFSLDGNKRALLMFSELPTLLDEEFLMPLLDNGLSSKIFKALDCVDEEEWLVGLVAGFSLMLQLVTLKKESLVKDLFYAILNSVWEMVNVKKREIVVRKGLLKIARKVGREALRFREPEYEAVADWVKMIQKISGVSKITKKVVKMVQELLDKYYMGGQVSGTANVTDTGTGLVIND
ncbi:uncharacterized protein LOC17895344 [Capsella rubella]|uniref:uncharacterized protein LOC17895344 n=1 Tax=Capsella rubella TaxID=81985 RepID=UPI000CD4ADCE|nr:uncharacterized protein LOC17895344 [Capsella rubella]